MKIKNILLYLLLFTTQNLFCQFDTLFWFAAPEVSQANLNFDRPIYVWLTSSSQPSQVTISQPANTIFTPIVVNLGANSTQFVNLTAWIDQIETKPPNQILNYGLKISATNPINAYYEVLSLQCLCNPEIYVFKGKNSLGTNFMIPMQNMLNNASHSSYTPTPYSSFVIVSTEDSTHITITPTANVVGHNANIPYNITLHKGQTYSATATSQMATQHLNGSIVVSDKPISITINDDLISGGIYGTCADVAGDQIIPIQNLGTKYVVVRGFLTSPYDKVFILATQNNTTISINGVAMTTLSNGQTYMYSMNTSDAAYIESNWPIYVLQMSGFGCEIGNCLVPQIECSGSNSVTFTRSTSDPLHLMLIVPSGAEGNFQINGNSTLITTSQFASVPGTSNLWKYAKITFTALQIPVGVSTTVTNSSEKFHLGMIHGTASGGCRFGYFSDFARFQYEIVSNGTNVCIGDTIMLGVNTYPNATYNWVGPNNFQSNSPSSQIVNVNTSNQGLYIVNGVADACTVIPDSIYIQVDTMINPMLYSNGFHFCEGDTLRIYSNLQQGITYAWETPNGTILNMDTIINNNLTINNSGQYFMNNFSNVCPISIDTMVIQVDSIINSSIFANDTIFCEGDTLRLFSNLSTNLNILWNLPYGANFSSDSLVINEINHNQAGSYFVSGSNYYCPIIPDSIVIYIDTIANFQLFSNDTIFCIEDTLEIYTTLPGNADFFWNTPTNNHLESDSVILNHITELDEGYYYINVNNNHCPAASDSLRIQVETPSIIDITSNEINFCIGDTLNLNVNSTQEVSLQWSGPNGFISNISNIQIYPAETLHSGLYIINANDTVCSVEPDSIIINVYDQPLITIDPLNPEICVGESIELTANGGVTYNWSTSEHTESIIVSPTTNETYMVVVSDLHECKDTIMTDVIVKPIPFLTISPDPIVIFLGEVVTLTVTSDLPGTNFLWSNGEVNSSIEIYPDHSMTIGVEGNFEGCVNFEEIGIIVKIPLTESYIYLPNSFTPDGNGINDIFIPLLDNAEIVSIKIFNRWGQLIFVSNNSLIGWDGTFNGQPCTEGVYSYMIRYIQTDTRESKQKYGSVSLIR